MKKLILITGMILISCVLISSLASPAAAPSVPRTRVTAPREEGYILKSENGMLVVYRAGEGEPFLRTETYTAMLPKADRKALEKGLSLPDSRALREALEDYCS